MFSGAYNSYHFISLIAYYLVRKNQYPAYLRYVVHIHIRCDADAIILLEETTNKECFLRLLFNSVLVLY